MTKLLFNFINLSFFPSFLFSCLLSFSLSLLLSLPCLFSFSPPLSLSLNIYLSFSFILFFISSIIYLSASNVFIYNSSLSFYLKITYLSLSSAVCLAVPVIYVFLSVNICPCHCVSVYCLSLSLSFICLISIYILFIFSCPSLCLTPSPCAYHSHSIFISLTPVISYFMVSFCPFISFQGLSICFFFLFSCLTLSNLISSCQPLLICLLLFWHQISQSQKNHMWKMCVGPSLSRGDAQGTFTRHRVRCKPLQTPDLSSRGAFLDLPPHLFIPNWVSQRKGRSWFVSCDFMAGAPGSAACQQPKLPLLCQHPALEFVFVCLEILLLS